MYHIYWLEVKPRARLKAFLRCFSNGPLQKCESRASENGYDWLGSAYRGQRTFQTVRAFFVEGEPLYPQAGLRGLDHVQICVRDPQQIIGYFLPRERARP